MQPAAVRHGKIIVHADDLGLSPSVNAAILRAHLSGIVTSTALMANMPASEDGCRRLSAAPELDVGLHLNLTEGLPLTSARSLRAADGRFRNLNAQLIALVLGRVDAAEVAAEFDAQIARARELGVEPSHLNGHEHIHLFGAAKTVTLDHARRHRISVRRPRERWSGDLGGSAMYLLRRLVLHAGSWTGDWSSILVTDGFLELNGPRRGRSADWLVGRLSTKRGVIELMCHPGEAPGDPDDPLVAHRPKESAILTTPGLRDRLREAGVELTTFSREFGSAVGTTRRPLGVA